MLAFAAFVALGVWQVRRMYWKHDLIARVDARIHAMPVGLPAEARLSHTRPDNVDYLRVRLSGAYTGSATALVRAITDLGTGYWAMVPMRLDDGSTIWVNRGFVPAGTIRAQVLAGVPHGRVETIGLLRSTEPGGSLLQANRPEKDRWYSRDVAALSLAKGVSRTAPVFVDAQSEIARKPKGGASPVPGLTVVRFADNHLQYALTWFAMAGLSLVGLALVWRRTAVKSP